MIFRFDGISLVSTMHYRSQRGYSFITAIADTGCTVTYIGFNSLCKLLGKRSEEEVEKLRSSLSDLSSNYYGHSGNANGVKDTVVRAVVKNVILDKDGCNMWIPQLRCRVNLNDSPSEIPYILMGLDFLYSFESCLLDKSGFTCNSFDSYNYNKRVNEVMENSVKVYFAEDDAASGRTGISNLLRMAGGDLI